MALTSIEAQTLLTQNPSQYGTPQALRDLANLVAADAIGSTTVLYSGNVGDVRASQIVSSMIANGDSIRALDSTQVYDFIGSDTNGA